jgi:tungstate transport system substrate-binding protein
MIRCMILSLAGRISKRSAASSIDQPPRASVRLFACQPQASALRLIVLNCTLLCLGLIGCDSQHDPQAITLATTTSTRDSGLLDVLVPMFEQQTGVEVKVVAVGTGQALAMGRRGDADVLLTHAPPAEKVFMDEGHGSDLRPVMYNDFVIVGPRLDVAQVESKKDATAALKAIAEHAAPFVSRGDESGTHMKERLLWEAAEVQPNGDWYIEAGGGMAHCLRLASERQAYCLCDRSTFLAHQKHLDLAVVCEFDPALRNPYAVILVNPARHPDIHHTAAQQFADFLTSPAAQEVIRTFGREKHGQPLFFLHSEQ